MNDHIWDGPYFCLPVKHRRSTPRGPRGYLTLYRPVGPQELDLIRHAGWREFPARLPHQPFSYPVLNEEYAIQIARDWNVKESGSGYVTRFRVDAEFLCRYEIRTVGSSIHKEFWIPANDLPEFNRHIIGLIEVVAEFSRPAP